MSAITFDTLKFVQTLEEAGVDRKQATAIAQAVRASHKTAEIATKSDIRGLRAEMREMELRMVTKLGSLMVVLMSVMLAILKL